MRSAACPPRFETVEQANDWLERRATGQERRALLLKRMHGSLAIFWAAMIPVSILTGLRSSVPYLVGLSVYALMVGHFGSWQGARAEVASGTTEEGT